MARSSPAIPNWIISLASPHVDIPLLPFFLGTVIGVSPLGWVCVRAGAMIKLGLDSDGMAEWWKSPENIGIIFGMMLIGIIPRLVQKLMDYDNQEKKNDAEY